MYIFTEGCGYLHIILYYFFPKYWYISSPAGSSTDISEDWEKDFDLDMTEEEVQLALSKVEASGEVSYDKPHIFITMPFV